MEKKDGGVILVGPAYPFRGGIAHYTTQLYREFKKTHSVALINFSRQYPSLFFPGVTQLDMSHTAFTVESERLLNPINPFSWMKTFARIKALGSPLVVFQWWHPFLGICFGTLCRLLRIFTTQKPIFICHNLLPHESHWAAWLLTRFALSRAEKLIVHSQIDRKQAEEMFPGIQVIAHPHPAYDQFLYKGLSQSEARTRLSLEGPVLLFFGYVRPYKGLRYLLRALPEVLKDIDVTLIIAGEFYEEKQAYGDLIKNLDLTHHIRLIDQYIPNEEVEIYFSACDLVVCPYSSGTQSGIIQIAYSFHKPVICTRVGGLPEVVVEGKTGFVVPPQNPQALAAAILAYYHSPDKTMYRTEITAIQERFRWEQLIAVITGS